MSAAAPIPPDRIRYAMTVRKLGVEALAKEAGLGINTVSRALAGRPLRLKTWLALSSALARHEADPDVERVLGELSA